MEQLIEFAGNHLMLVIALFVISGALAWNLIAGGGKNNIPPHEATTLIKPEIGAPGASVSAVAGTGTDTGTATPRWK